jgi:hypothetical protein
MRVRLSVIGLFLALVQSGPCLSQSRYDRPTVVKVLGKKCQQDHLQNPEAVTNLAILEITVAALCECASNQVVSRMADADIAYMVKNSKLNEATLANYLAARKFCAATLAR